MKENELIHSGLSESQVQDRVLRGQVNKSSNPSSKSYGQILSQHIFTFFNLVNVILFILVLAVGSHKNSLFIVVIVVNTVIGLYQEIKAKRLLDKLSLLTSSKVKTYRANRLVDLEIEDLVMDDIILLSTGNQIPCDAHVIEGSIEANEALLTGEADTIAKVEGDELFSGSFVTSGQALAQVIHVGDENYIQKLALEAKQIKKQDRLLQDSLNQVIHIVSYFMLPLGILLFLKEFYIGHMALQQAVVSTVAAVIGMFPQGLVLLTSAALTLGVIQLARQNVLVQELHVVDSLARVDVLCLDKTGTLTEGKMKVEAVEALSDIDIDTIMGNVLSQLSDENATSLALRDKFPSVESLTSNHVIPFSSDRKYSGVAFENKGTYYLGAVQFLFPQGQESLKEKARNLAEEGLRVIVLAHSQNIQSDVQLPDNLEALAFFTLSDIIREDARTTLEYFRTQGVTCKVISGDDPITVSKIAERVGMTGADSYVDATTLTTSEDIAQAVEKYTIFGRVTPKQKKEMVTALKAQNHTVAMTGDGVNDILAFKEADCSIAMNAGSDAAKQVANIILLNNNFSAMPHIVNEGRRVINNISRTGSLLFVKVIFSIILTVITILLGKAYPFEPIQLTVIIAWFVTTPSVFLSFERDFSKIK
ncbi:MAG: HAD-IC family P-type ATPase, partial [Streptococcaceae bacterium]|nr:HAD-IC family P-type ATPase [Streptococcaceae bacterium]